jgi:hypothetical protein
LIRLLLLLLLSYPNWYPFAPGDEDATFRFELSV